MKENSSLSKANVLRLASYATSEGAGALRGLLRRGPDGRLALGERNLDEWLGQYEGREVIVILAPIGDELHSQPRQCGICGRDYEGAECPHCASARARLRGR